MTTFKKINFYIINISLNIERINQQQLLEMEDNIGKVQWNYAISVCRFS